MYILLPKAMYLIWLSPYISFYILLCLVTTIISKLESQWVIAVLYSTFKSVATNWIWWAMTFTFLAFTSRWAARFGSKLASAVMRFLHATSVIYNLTNDKLVIMIWLEDQRYKLLYLYVKYGTCCKSERSITITRTTN